MAHSARAGKWAFGFSDIIPCGLLGYVCQIKAQGSTNWSILSSRMRENGEHRKHEKMQNLNHMTQNTLFMIQNILFVIQNTLLVTQTLFLSTRWLKTLDFKAFMTTFKIKTYALGEHDPWSAQNRRTSSEMWSPGSSYHSLKISKVRWEVTSSIFIFGDHLVSIGEHLATTWRLFMISD